MHDRILRIRAFPDPDQRLQVLLSLSVTKLIQLASGTCIVSEVPIRPMIEVACESLRAIRTRQSTVEQAILQQTNFRATVSQLVMLVFFALGWPVADEDEFQREILPSDGEDFTFAQSGLELLQEYRSWGIRQLHTQPLNPRDDADSEEFRTLCTQLALKLSSEATPPTGPTVTRLVNAIVKQRAANQAIRAKSRMVSALDTDNIDRPIREGFVIYLGSNRTHLAGMVSTQLGIRIWCSQRWAQIATKFPQHAGIDFKPFLRAVDEWVSTFLIESRKSFLCRATPAPTGDAAEELPVNDFTGQALPLACVFDAEKTFAYIATGVWIPPNRPRNRLLYFGRVRFHEQDLLLCDDDRRTVTEASTNRTLLHYPQLTPADQLNDYALLLPYGNYDLWCLEEHAPNHQIDVVKLTDGHATRSQFLAIDPGEFRVVHLSTHGDAETQFPECSRLWASPESNGVHAITFVDIQGKDWSGVDLVFLSACKTASGRTTSGDGALSLAWAFAAGGAKAVISARWSIPDDAAWYFTEAFYDAWRFSTEPNSIIAAFHAAQSRLRAHPEFSRPSIWGAFCLLHASSILEVPSPDR